MDWTALRVSLELGLVTAALIAPIALFVAHRLAFAAKRRAVMEALIVLPLVLPPTVLGFYLLLLFSPQSWLGGLWRDAFSQSLTFSFEGIVLASLIANLPFAIQPLQRSFEAIPRDVREAAACCGMSPWRRFRRIELPLAWPGMLTGLVLTFAHTLGEFGVVLMVGGSIAGETRTLSIAIYDASQAFDERGAGVMAACLMMMALAAVLAVSRIGPKRRVSN